MVQVDIFWAYGLGATMAAASGRQLVKEKSPFVNEYFVKTLLYLSLIWAPTGLLLLLRHPSWETMQVASSLGSIHEFIVLGFGITNVTQGILGFWITYKLLQNKSYYLAHFNWLIGYLGMFFILLYGWDGFGYDRFLYDRDMFGGVPWAPGAGLQAGAGIKFLISSVAMTLYLDGIYLVPMSLYMFSKWTKTTAEADPTLPKEAVPKSMTKLWIMYLIIVFGIALPTAGLAAITVHYVGKITGHVASYFIGLPLFSIMAYYLLYRKGMPVHRIISTVIPEEFKA